MQAHLTIDDRLMQRALAVSGLQTEQKTVEEALRLLVRLKEQERIRAARASSHGTGTWTACGVIETDGPGRFLGLDRPLRISHRIRKIFPDDLDNSSAPLSAQSSGTTEIVNGDNPRQQSSLVPFHHLDNLATVVWTIADVNRQVWPVEVKSIKRSVQD